MPNQSNPIQVKTLEERIAELEAKRLETGAKLKERLKYFHGIRHESSDSEYKYNQIKVLEAHVESLTVEIEELKNQLTPKGR